MQKNIITNIDNIFRKLSDKITDPRTELYYVNDLTLLIAVSLSANTTDSSVNKATKKLFPHYNTTTALIELGENNLKEYIKSVGLFNNKARNVINLCKILHEEYGYITEIPDNFDGLVALPGVGRKTANVVLNTVFDHNTIAVDTHVFRVSNRIGLAQSKNILEVENQLMKITPKKWLKDAHHFLVLHGRYTCKARKPLCENCCIAQYCTFYQESQNK